ncbi:MAG: kelch repeat-containing protein [Acidimicrobiales bacterium]
MATQALKCERHGEATRLTCVECGKPICPKCAVRTDVGLKCEADAKGVELSKETLAMLRPSRTPLYLGLAGLGLIVALVLFLSSRGGDDAETPTAALPAVGTWSAVPDLVNIRGTTTAVVLKNGKALAVGGGVGQQAVAAAEIFDPAAGVWQSTGAMNQPRRGHQAALLGDGRVMVAGGIHEGELLSSAEIYDPDTARWTTVAPMSVARLGSTLTLLTNGNVLVTGGNVLDAASGTGGGQTIRPDGTAEIYNVAANRWTKTSGALSTPRFEHTATALDDGRVLIAGGQGPPIAGNTGALASTEIYDPAVDSFRKSNDMGDARFNHAALKLPDRSVMVVGGAGGTNGDTSLSTAEVFNPGDGSWTSAGALTGSRSGHAAAVFPDGRVVVAGGESITRGNRRALATAEIFALEKREWRSAGNMNCPRSEASAALLGDGSVLVVAGDFAAPGQQPDPKGCADRYRP